MNWDSVTICYIVVCITPASGFVSPASSLVFGFTGSVCCNFALNLKHFLKYDDALDVFAVHGVGGIAGMRFYVFYLMFRG